MSRRLLFLCSRNKLRSPTAEEIFRSYPGIEVDSAGLATDAVTPLEPDQIEWADLIIAMEEIHLSRLKRRFGSLLAAKRVAVLNVPDDYGFMDPDLIQLLKVRCAPFLP